MKGIERDCFERVDNFTDLHQKEASGIIMKGIEGVLKLRWIEKTREV